MTDEQQRSTMVIQHTQTQFYRVVHSDGGMVHSFIDPASMRFQITFFRFDFNPVIETQIVVPQPAGRGFSVVDQKVEQTLKKVDEVAVMMTPDKLFDLASSIVGQLNAMTPEIHAQYNIPLELVVTAKGLGGKI